MIQIVIRQQRDMKRRIMLGGIEVIGFAVIIHEQIHVTRHLAAFNMRTENIELRVLRSRAAAKLLLFRPGPRNRSRVFLFRCHILRPHSSVRTNAADVGIRAAGFVSNRDT